jgi:hypothetical protein
MKQAQLLVVVPGVHRLALASLVRYACGRTLVCASLLVQAIRHSG